MKNERRLLGEQYDGDQFVRLKKGRRRWQRLTIRVSGGKKLTNLA